VSRGDAKGGVLRRRMGAGALVLAAAGYVVVAIGSGLDRISLDSPEIAGNVPLAWANRALPALWQQALARRDGAAMDRIARLAVDRAPLQASSTAMYGATLQYLQRADAADAAFRVAARMGWRVPVTQIYWLQQGLLSGDYPTAARRLDALMRLDVPTPGLPAILEGFESNPLAAAALIDQMADRPPWLDGYIAEIGELSGERLTRRLDMIGLMVQAGIPTQCAKAGTTAERLVARGHVGEARQFWALMCGGSPDSLVADGNLAQLRLNDAGGPFRWTYLTNGDVTADLVPDGSRGGQWLVAHNDSSVGIALIRQRIVAPAGRYRLEWSSPGDATGPAFFPATGCAADDATPLHDVRRQGGEAWQASFTVDRNCDGTWLQFWLAGGGQGRLGRVAVTAAP